MKRIHKCMRSPTMTRCCCSTGLTMLLLFLVLTTNAGCCICMLAPCDAACCLPFLTKMDSKKFICEASNNPSGSGNDNFTVQDAFRMLDADFFSKEKMVDIVKEASEFNLPTAQADRKLVATKDGGLKYPSVLVFRPDWKSAKQEESTNLTFVYPFVPDIQKPANEEDIAYMSVLELGQLIKTKKISSVELTEIFLRRLKRYNHVLQAVVTITDDLAYMQAKEADQLLSQGKYLGPLHGIPYGLKDIISVPHYKTTWGSGSFKDQVLDIEAWVYKRLKSSGAVLVAKLVSGSLAYDDIWFGGRTRNPWNIEEFSTGSSAGPAACTSADGDLLASPRDVHERGQNALKKTRVGLWGLYTTSIGVVGDISGHQMGRGMVPFAIGSETAGSITYPSARCGVTALRPTFGTVGRTGVMSISESLDKLGPFCRSAADCAVILDNIRGKDPDDISSQDMLFADPFHVDLTKLTVGYLDDAEMEVVNILASKGVNMVPFRLNYTVDSAQGIVNFTMDVEMLAHFDKWQRCGLDDAYEAQDQWPYELRRARVITAVDYLQAQRARGRLIQEVEKSFSVDAFIGNATDWEKVCVGNLVGMPVIVVPVGFAQIDNPPSRGTTRRRKTITTGVYAPPHRDHIALALAMAYQSVTDHHKQRPPVDDNGPDDQILNSASSTYLPRQLRG